MGSLQPTPENPAPKPSSELFSGFVIGVHRKMVCVFYYDNVFFSVDLIEFACATFTQMTLEKYFSYIVNSPKNCWSWSNLYTGNVYECNKKKMNVCLQ